MIDAFVFEVHHPIAMTVGYGFDCYLWCGRNASVSAFGDLAAVAKWQDDVLSVPSEYCKLSTEKGGELFIATFDMSGSGNAVVQFAGFGSQMLRTMHKYGTTFDCIAQTMDCDNYRHSVGIFGWDGDKYSHMRGWHETLPKRHFALAPHEFNIAEFKNWLPPITDKYDNSGIFGWSSGDVDGPAYQTLEMYEEGLQRTKLALCRFQFNPVPVICNLLSAAQLSKQLGQNREAKECYSRALTEARRMELYMAELMLLHENQIHVFAEKQGTGTAVSRLVGPPDQYRQLLS
jgi:hypothetical protein